jgi:3-hydroxypropanoate dehydrogenase
VTTTTRTPDDFLGNLELEKDAQDLLFRSARTANAFTDEPVSDEQVRAIYDLVRWGPTAMNAQPLRVVLVRTPDARGRLVEHMTGNNKAKTSIAPLTIILAADVDFHDELPRVFPHAEGARDRLHGDEAGRERMATFNALLQAAYLLVGIRAAGLAAGPMTGFDAAAVDADFFPDGRHRSLVVVNVGHPSLDAYRDRLPRLDYEDVVTAV